jgi:hypothetical protein
MLRIAEWEIRPLEDEIPKVLRLVIVDENGEKHDFQLYAQPAHRLSDELLRGVAKIIPRTGMG